MSKNLVSQPLAVKYRPKLFSDIAGQKTAVTRMKGMIKRKDIPNAILLSGGSGIGKTTLARIFASHIQCETLNACGKCASCQMINKHPDIKELNASEARGIDEVRGMIKEAQFRPQIGNFRILIVDEAQGFTGPAAQALLMPLESPPANTLYILCTMELDKLLPAIVGRCNHIPLDKPSKEEIAARLSSIAKQEKATYLTDTLFERIAESSGGQVRNAVQLLEASIQYVAGLKEIPEAKKLEALVTKNLSSTFDVTDDKVAFKVLLGLMLGNPKVVNSALLDANDYFSLGNKLIWFTMFLIDHITVGRHSKVWYTPANQALLKVMEDKIEGFGVKQLRSLMRIQDSLVSLKVELGTFAVQERALMSARLNMLALSLRDK